MLGPTKPSVYRFKLGAYEVTTILDGAIQLDGPHPIFGADQKPEDVQKLAAENFLPTSRMAISFAPVLVNTGNELILFDTGNGAGRRPNAGALRATLGAAGYTPEQIDVVVLTHFHPDHIGGLMEDGAPAFANARYVTGAEEYNFWSPPEKATGKTERVGKLVQSNVVPLAEKTTFLEDNQAVVSGITAVDAGGHTPGHLAFHVESEGKRLMITADTANHYVVSLQRPDWEVSFDMNKKKAAEARKEIFGMIAADKIPFTGYHMPFPNVGYIEPMGDGFRYVAAGYQMDLG
ncbi:MBL fold metallo-hydrolase [Thalassobaculum fulvum]|jgi:glyoxylase-like metal-dependent hydrolase (beta-lactamase superfamily II)|uniref:MBL fold metallo-hydrolase n=2 Tax=Thalassobaculum fulvum TaxID=1633335 RepID=A0A919CPV8_9PROT|nr:MBL fold metallo-hydrolase [Thalassobaculum fulvum]